MEGPVLVTVEMSVNGQSVRPSVRHALALCQTDASYDHKMTKSSHTDSLRVVVLRIISSSNSLLPTFFSSLQRMFVKSTHLAVFSFSPIDWVQWTGLSYF